MPATCRFAPSPNGPLHLGHAYSALRNEQVAKRIGTRLLLRLENIDTARCTPSFERAVYDDLAWFGYCWTGVVLRQSDRFALYAAALGQLGASGLLFPCFCSRGDILRAIGHRSSWPRDPDGSPLYPGTCRALSERERARRLSFGQPHALRLDMARARSGAAASLGWTEYHEGADGARLPAEPARWGDAVLRRKDIPASYHIAVVVDDADQGVTDVVRGSDLFAATALHRLLQVLLDLPEPRYHHHRLVPDENGRKLSKSRGAPALADLRRQGADASAIRLRLEAMMAVQDEAHGSSVVSQ